MIKSYFLLRLARFAFSLLARSLSSSLTLQLAHSLTMSGVGGGGGGERPRNLDFSMVQQTLHTAEPCGGNVAPPPVDTRGGGDDDGTSLFGPECQVRGLARHRGFWGTPPMDEDPAYSVICRCAVCAAPVDTRGGGAGGGERPPNLDFSMVQQTLHTAEPCGGNVAPPPVDTLGVVRPARLNLASVLSPYSNVASPLSGARAPRSPSGTDQSPDSPPAKKRSRK